MPDNNDMDPTVERELQQAWQALDDATKARVDENGGHDRNHHVHIQRVTEGQ